jgi:hypothetical protein
VFDFGVSEPEKLDSDVVALFESLDPERHDVLISFGWAMAEELAAKHGS